MNGARGTGRPAEGRGTEAPNESGKAIVCPILKDATEGPLHIPLRECPVEGVVLCEQVRYVDLSARRFSKLAESRYFDIMDISDAVMAMFDYQE